MLASKFKPAAATAVALAALLALGACGKKVEDTGATPSSSSTPAATTPSTSSMPSTTPSSTDTSATPTPGASAAAANAGVTPAGTPASGSTK
ncbi:hypothetical protein SAMN05216350_107104 [Polaromonas sp. YR568]|uniref:hypothetical protein n=1 Tax=Polaromonas sp. YR568 TaxID=1855301 RepID=UPI0008EAC70C|nr:hypothetical protein [Polaromonas sp. YR568]SFU88629.1 hypothetical protein SAMN05216350_107104 [Polaromonas sp. YR568]